MSKLPSPLEELQDEHEHLFRVAFGLFMLVVILLIGIFYLIFFK